jgi:hypothetical protein
LRKKSDYHCEALERAEVRNKAKRLTHLIANATDEQYGTFNTLMKTVDNKKKEIERLAQQFGKSQPPVCETFSYCK